MPCELLSRDNPQLSEPLLQPFGAAHLHAVNCTDQLTEDAAAYIRDSLAENTRRAYLSDLTHFENWGGTIPASATMLASYLSAHAGVLKTATLVRRLASISKAHRARGLPNHAQSELVRTTLRGIRRKHGTRQAEARPLLKDELFQVLDAIGDELRDARDRALLLIGFAGGFRRSELVSLNIEDLEFVRQGVVITLSRSKTDQTGAGRKIAIPLARGRWCPVVALEDLIRRSGTTAGAVFRSINRYGHVGQERLSGEAVSLIIRARMQAAGLRSDGYSGHSLRAGFATSAAQAGVATSKIRLQTGHKSDAMLARYIRDGDLFLNNAAGVVL